MQFKAFLLSAHRDKDKSANKWTSLHVVFLGKTLNWIPPSLCGRQIIGPSILSILVTQCNERLVYFHCRLMTMLLLLT